MPSEFTRNQLETAITLAWDNKATLLVYPEDMDLIVVDIPREEYGYLSSRTYVVDTNQFESKQEFHSFIHNIIA